MSRRGGLRWLAGISAVGLGLVAAGGFRWADRVAGPGEPGAAMRRGIGQPIPDLPLRDAATGRATSIHALRGRAATVLVFTGVDCPVGDLYMSRLAGLAGAYRERGVAFLAVNSNARESAARAAEHAREYGVAFPVLKDAENVVADALMAERTCEALVLDGAGRLRYRGAIDDQYGRGTRRAGPSRTYLADALEALLAGRAVALAATPVVGCPIDRVDLPVLAGRGLRVRPAPAALAAALESREPAVEVGRVTFAGAVAPILREKCESCHRPGQSAPFALRGYDDARRHASAIREAVADRRMPPWHADPRHGRFANDRSLSGRQRATLLAWVDQGAPEGDRRDLPPPREFPEGWAIGRPDVVIEMPEPFVVPASGTVPYQRVRVPTGFARDTWVQAAEARPGDRSVVHHILVFIHRPDLGATRLKRTGRLVVGYAPGDMPAIYPPGTAKLIPAGTELLFEVHYTPTGRARVDRSRIGLILARGPVTRQAVTKGIPQKDLRIPPGEANYPASSSHTFARDSHLLSLMPHMHLRGKDFAYTAAYPDGRSEVLLSVPAYDFAWQSVYRLAEPKALPAGTRIDCLAHFDNSAANPANPDPTRAVRWGDQSWEEMMTGYVDYCEDVDAGVGSDAFVVE